MNDVEIRSPLYRRPKSRAFHSYDTIEVAQFIATDGPKNAQEADDLLFAILEYCRAGQYAALKTHDRSKLYIFGPQSILFTDSLDRAKIAEICIDFLIAEPQQLDLLSWED